MTEDELTKAEQLLEQKEKRDDTTFMHVNDIFDQRDEA